MCNRAIITQPLPHCRGKGAAVILDYRSLKGRNLNQRLCQIVIVLNVGSICLGPADTEGHILIPDGTGKHLAVCILVEVDRGNKSVTV